MPTAAASEPRAARYPVAAALTTAVLLGVTAYAAVAQTALTRVRIARSGAVLANLKGEPAAQLDRLSGRTVHRALTAAPLDQRVVNVAMAREVRQQGEARLSAWLAVLSRLGWRDTVTLQNRLYIGALRNDLSGVMDLTDALLRRRQLTDEMIPVVSLLEADPALRPQLVERLSTDPSWRGLYLTTVAHLKTPDQLRARAALVEALAARGRLDRDEIVPSINALDRAGLTAQAFAMWRRVQPGVTRPLADTGFVQASRSYDTRHDPVPFQWQMMTGDGFSADATRDGVGNGAALTIDWSGRGVPVFVQQRTSAAPGYYAIDLDVPAEEKVELPALSFRLVCGDAIVPFVATPQDPRRLRTAGAVRCAFPLLQIAGDLQSSTAAHQVTIRRITMRPLGSAPEAG